MNFLHSILVLLLKVFLLFLHLLYWFLSTFNHLFSCLMQTLKDLFACQRSHFEIFPSLVCVIHAVPIFNVLSFLNFVVNFNLLIDSQPRYDFLDEFCIFFEFKMGLILGICHCHNGIKDFGIKKDRMIVLIIPTLFPKAHDLTDLFFSIVLIIWQDLEFLSYFFLQTVHQFKGLTLLDFLAISDVWYVVFFHLYWFFMYRLLFFVLKFITYHLELLLLAKVYIKFSHLGYLIL